MNKQLKGKSHGTGNDRDASNLCTFVYEGDVEQLKRVIAQGADVNAGDYDRRTAMHIAASEGNVAMVESETL